MQNFVPPRIFLSRGKKFQKILAGARARRRGEIFAAKKFGKSYRITRYLRIFKAQPGPGAGPGPGRAGAGPGPEIPGNFPAVTGPVKILTQTGFLDPLEQVLINSSYRLL